MSTLLEIQKAADTLTAEEQAGLAAHLLASFSSAPLGPDDDEVSLRETAMTNGTVKLLNHSEFAASVRKP